MSEWKFKRDTAFRKQLFVPDSFAHPAKMDSQLLIKIVEEYTKPGEAILDPMAGSGTTMLACTLGRNVILVELEEKFCKMCRDNWEVVRMHPQLGYEMGACQIIQGDARSLEGLADKIITSPPYEGTEARDRSKEGWWEEERERKHSGGSVKIAKGYSVDHIITSPPYETPMKYDGENKRRKVLDGQKLGQRDDVYFSKGNIAWQGLEAGYGHSEGNIGNLKGDTYLSAMFQVYQQCYKVLREGGLMILVTKNFIRNKKEIQLGEDTIKICEQAGFRFAERHYRKLTAQSFWRITYQKKYPDAPVLDKEDVLVFEK